MSRWITAAHALHKGALEDSSLTFQSTAEIVAHLCTYNASGHGSDGKAAAERGYLYDLGQSSSSTRCTPKALSSFFPEDTSSPCVLCKDVKMYWNSLLGQYDLRNAETVTVTKPDPDSLNAMRLQHLATLHTPYFLLLFVGLAQKKGYIFTEEEMRNMANRLLLMLGDADPEGTRDHDPASALMLWWRYQDRQGAKELNMPTPSYILLTRDRKTHSRWTPAYDRFDARRPAPLYAFIRDNCLYHEPFRAHTSSRTGDPRSQGLLSTVTQSKLRTVPQGDVCTFVLNVCVPKGHLEPTMHNIARAHVSRKTTVLNYLRDSDNMMRLEVSAPLSPRLDCIGLVENTSDAVEMYVVSTTECGWETLDAWLTSVRSPSSDVMCKVLLGVLGSLVDLVVAHQRPCRGLYANQGSARGPSSTRLSAAFLVHKTTGETLSMLTYVSMSKL